MLFHSSFHFSLINIYGTIREIKIKRNLGDCVFFFFPFWKSTHKKKLIKKIKIIKAMPQNAPTLKSRLQQKNFPGEGGYSSSYV